MSYLSQYLTISSHFYKCIIRTISLICPFKETKQNESPFCRKKCTFCQSVCFRKKKGIKSHREEVNYEDFFWPSKKDTTVYNGFISHSYGRQ